MGSCWRSCLRPGKAGRLPRQAREPHVIPQALVRVAQVLPSGHLGHSAQPLAKPLRRVCVEHSVGTRFKRSMVVLSSTTPYRACVNSRILRLFSSTLGSGQASQS